MIAGDAVEEEGCGVNELVVLVEELTTGLRHAFALRSLPGSLGSDEWAHARIARSYLAGIHCFFGATPDGLVFRLTEHALGETLVDGKTVSPGTRIPLDKKSTVLISGQLRVTILDLPVDQVTTTKNPFEEAHPFRLPANGATDPDHQRHHQRGPQQLGPDDANLSDEEDERIEDGRIEGEAAPEEDHHLPPGATFGRYVIKRVLADGGMGTVYLASDPIAKRRVAIKTLMPDLTANPEAQERLLHEARAAAQLESVHIVRILDIGQDANKSVYIVMEYLKGVDLGEHLENVGRVPEQEGADIICGVCRGLGAAHQQHILHRDIKTKNIFLAETYEGLVVKILDFGVARSVRSRDPKLTADGAIIGTSYYMSPEQASGLPLDQRCDVFSVGVVLYEILTGKRPFDGDNWAAILAKIIKGEYPKPRSVLPSMNPALEQIIMKALAVNREDRYSSVNELGADLVRFASPEQRDQLSRHFTAPQPRPSEASSFGPDPRASKFVRPAPRSPVLRPSSIPPLQAHPALSEKGAPTSDAATVPSRPSGARVVAPSPDVEGPVDQAAPVRREPAAGSTRTMHPMQVGGADLRPTSAPPFRAPRQTPRRPRSSTELRKLLVAGGVAAAIGLVTTWFLLPSHSKSGSRPIVPLGVAHDAPESPSPPPLAPSPVDGVRGPTPTTTVIVSATAPRPKMEEPRPASQPPVKARALPSSPSISDPVEPSRRTPRAPRPPRSSRPHHPPKPDTKYTTNRVPLL